MPVAMDSIRARRPGWAAAAAPRRYSISVSPITRTISSAILLTVGAGSRSRGAWHTGMQVQILLHVQTVLQVQVPTMLQTHVRCAVGRGVGWGVGLVVGLAVGLGVRRGVGRGVGRVVRVGLALAVGRAVGRGVGFGVGFGLAVGLGVSSAVALAITRVASDGPQAPRRASTALAARPTRRKPRLSVSASHGGSSTEKISGSVSVPSEKTCRIS